MSTKKLISKAQSGIQFPVILQLAVADNTRYVRPITDVEIDRANGLPEGTTTMRRVISEQANKQQPVIKQDNATTETHKSINKAVKKAQAVKKVNAIANTVAAVASIPATIAAPEVMTPIFAIQGAKDASDVLSKEEKLTPEDYGRLGLDALFMFPTVRLAGNYFRFNTNLGRALELSRELNKGIRNATRYGDIRVSESALQDPTKFYRFVEQPEVGTIEELGFNVTSGDAKTLSSAANRYRVNNLTHYNKTKTEGKRPGLLTKSSSSHGNTSQASVGKPWNGSINQSNNLFRRGVLEGDLYEGILASNGNRSVFNPTSLSDLSLGQRIGFRTGTMPIENLRYFEDLGNGMYRYNGQVLPEQRIYQIVNQEYIPTLNIQDVLNTKISLNHVLPKLYVIPNFTSKHGSLAMPSTADTPVGWGNSPVLFLKNSAISKYPHQAYIGDGQVNTVNGVFGRNKDFSNYSLSELRDGLNSKMDKVKEVYLPEKSTPTTDENMIFNSKLRRYLSDRNPDAYIGPSYDELHFHSAIPLRDFKYAFLPDYETAPELLPLFDKYGIKTNFEFADKRGVDLEAFRKWITDNDKEIGFKKGGKLRLINRE